MSVLQRFEKRLEGLVEGAFAKVFKGVVHPVEILNAMQREAEAHKAILAGGRTLVPNRYVIDLSPYDHSRLAPYAAALATEREWYSDGDPPSPTADLPGLVDRGPASVSLTTRAAA